LDRTDGRSGEFACGWALTALVALADALWLAVGPFRLAARGYGSVAFGVLALGGLALFYRFVRRLADDRVATAAHAGALLVAWTAVAAPFSYLLASAGAPLQDEFFARLDAGFGFDWPAWFAFTRRVPGLAPALQVAYATSLAQVAVAIAGLGVLGHEARVREATTLMIWTSLAIVLVSAALPAMGAYAWFATAPELCLWCAPLAGLRDGGLRDLALDGMVGLVQFPSFHTALALIVPWACRGLPRLFVPAALLNAAVLVSIPTEGGHFLADMAGGGAITVAAIALRRRVFGAVPPGPGG
jgi:hypothetical protein